MSATFFVVLAEKNQALIKASKQQGANESILESPRLLQLKAQVAGGDRSALNRFWEAMASEHAPLLEPIPNEPGKVLVSFLWRAAPGTTGVMVVGQQMTRLLETDLWCTTQSWIATIPIFYSFFPSVSGEAEIHLRTRSTRIAL